MGVGGQEPPRRGRVGGAGPAELTEGTTPSGGLSTGLELYILAHGKRAYVLSFTIDAKVLTQGTVFGSIAEHFAFL